MVQQNQNSANSAESVSFPEEYLQVTENGGTFAPAVDEYDPAGKGRYVSPMVDYGFKMIFEKEDILREFLNDLLNPPTPIREVHYLMRGMTPPSRKERKAEYDLRCVTEDGTEFIVEMQNAPQEFFADRIIYYLSKTIAPQAKVGQKSENKYGNEIDWNYELHPVFGIFFANFHLQGLEPLVIRTVRFKVEETGEVFNDKVRAYTIELPCFKGKTKEDSRTRIEKWVYNLLNMKDMTTPLAFQDEMPVFKRLATVAEIANMTPEEYRDYIDDIDRQRTKNAQMAYAKKLAREEGLAEGRAEGLAEGRAEGRLEGERAATIKNAIAMKKNGAPIDFIVKCLGMTPEGIEALPVE